MMIETVTYECWKYNSQNIVKNGQNSSGSQQYWCKDCRARAVLKQQNSYTDAMALPLTATAGPPVNRPKLSDTN